MARRTLRSLAVLAGLGIAAGLSGCTVYDAGPPAYPYGSYYSDPGYYAPAPYYSAPDVYFGFGGGDGWHHRRWRHWR